MQYDRQSTARNTRRRDERVENLLGEIESLYEDAIQALEARAPAINEAMAFYTGNQWGSATPFGFWSDVDDTGESQETYNYIRPTVRSAVASMLRAMPAPVVVAAHESYDAIVRAMATQELVRSLLRNETIPFEQIYRGELDATIKGAVWYKVYYDPHAGRVRVVPKTRAVETPGGVEQVPELDALGRPVFEEQFEGGIKVEFRDIVDVLPDPNATQEDEVGYVFDRKMVAVWKLDDMFPEDVFGESTKGRWVAEIRDSVGQQRDAIENQQRGIGLGGRGHKAGPNELCELVEYWERPTRSRPKGRLVVFVGSVIVAMSDLPYEWPWVLRTGQNMIPNSLYAHGVVADLKSMQRTINLNASKKREWMDKILSPPMLIPRGSGVARDFITDIAGELIEYERGYPPEWMQVPSIPNSMFQLEDQLVRIIKDVSTYSDVSRGEAPPEIRTGRALAYLHEFQEGVREPDVMLFRRSVLKILTKCLYLVRDFIPEGRMVKFVGENGAWMGRAFYRKDYDFESEIEMELDATSSSSRVVRLSQHAELFQMGAFEDTPAAKKFRKLAGVDTAERYTLDGTDAQRRRVRSIIMAIKEDPTLQLQALEQEDHEVFLEELDLFRVLPEYFALPPIAREKVDAYAAEHEQWLQMQFADFGAQQGMLGESGSPPAGQPGTPSPLDGGAGDIEGAQPGPPEPPPPAMEQQQAA